MPAIIAALGALLVTLLRIWAVSIIGRILLTIGIGLYAYNIGFPDLLAWIGAKFTVLPPFIRDSVGAAGLDVLVTMVLSACAVKMTSRFFFGKNA